MIEIEEKWMRQVFVLATGLLTGVKRSTIKVLTYHSDNSGHFRKHRAYYCIRREILTVAQRKVTVFVPRRDSFICDQNQQLVGGFAILHHRLRAFCASEHSMFHALRCSAFLKHVLLRRVRCVVEEGDVEEPSVKEKWAMAIVRSGRIRPKCRWYFVKVRN